MGKVKVSKVVFVVRMDGERPKVSRLTGPWIAEKARKRGEKARRESEARKRKRPEGRHAGPLLSPPVPPVHSCLPVHCPLSTVHLPHPAYTTYQRMGIPMMGP